VLNLAAKEFARRVSAPTPPRTARLPRRKASDGPVWLTLVGAHSCRGSGVDLMDVWCRACRVRWRLLAPVAAVALLMTVRQPCLMMRRARHLLATAPQ
jgi:hypothetical protein